MPSSFEHALIVGKFAPPHRGHQLLIETALAEAARVTVLVWSNPDFPSMPSERRAEWLRELYSNEGPSRLTVHVPTQPPLDDAPDEVQQSFTRAWLLEHGLRPDVVYTSEAYGEPLAARLGARHREVDRARVRVPVSGTLLREDVHAHRRFLDPRVYRHFVERVVLLGAESTGKTTLAARLAADFGTVWVPEYGREHYEQRGGRLELEDYLEIARRHRELEDEAALRATRYVFVDTNALTTLFFSHYYGRDSLPALRALADECSSRYSRTFVCGDDIPFVQDGWRDNAVWRARMQGMVLHDLIVRGIRYEVVEGSLDQRVAQVREALLRPIETQPPSRRGWNLGPRPGA